MEYNKRLQKLQIILKQSGCQALLIEDPTDLLYLTGLELSAGKLYISTFTACLVVDGRYFENCCKQTLYPVTLLEKFSFQAWVKDGSLQTLGFDSHQTSYQNYLALLNSCSDLKVSLIPIPAPLQQMRLIKDEDEIYLLRQAARLAQKGCQLVISSLREGITEEELAFELEFFWKKKGAKKLSFDPIIAFGKNSSMPHYRAGSTILKKGMHVLIDIGVVFQHYHSDMTRVVYFGEAEPKIQAIYAIVEEAKNRAMEKCHPGTLIGELDRTARNIIAESGYGNYFTHSLGHGVGLNVHEAPTIKTEGLWSQMPLEPGMVLTIEPGIYLPEIGGVRLEDTLLITEFGYENLTH
jgi:Xaa-Pro aminopeptidase